MSYQDGAADALKNPLRTQGLQFNLGGWKTSALINVALKEESKVYRSDGRTELTDDNYSDLLLAAKGAESLIAKNRDYRGIEESEVDKFLSNNGLYSIDSKDGLASRPDAINDFASNGAASVIAQENSLFRRIFDFNFKGGTDNDEDAVDNPIAGLNLNGSKGDFELATFISQDTGILTKNRSAAELTKVADSKSGETLFDLLSKNLYSSSAVKLGQEEATSTLKTPKDLYNVLTRLNGLDKDEVKQFFTGDDAVIRVKDTSGNEILPTARTTTDASDGKVPFWTLPEGATVEINYSALAALGTRRPVDSIKEIPDSAEQEKLKDPGTDLSGTALPKPSSTSSSSSSTPTSPTVTAPPVSEAKAKEILKSITKNFSDSELDTVVKNTDSKEGLSLIDKAIRTAKVQNANTGEISAYPSNDATSLLSNPNIDWRSRLLASLGIDKINKQLKADSKPLIDTSDAIRPGYISLTDAFKLLGIETNPNEQEKAIKNLQNLLLDDNNAAAQALNQTFRNADPAPSELAQLMQIASAATPLTPNTPAPITPSNPIPVRPIQPNNSNQIVVPPGGNIVINSGPGGVTTITTPYNTQPQSFPPTAPNGQINNNPLIGQPVNGRIPFVITQGQNGPLYIAPNTDGNGLRVVPLSQAGTQPVPQQQIQQPLYLPPTQQQPIASQPQYVQPVTQQPTAAQPQYVQPVTQQPTAAQPQYVQPVTQQPIAAQPIPQQQVVPQAAPLPQQTIIQQVNVNPSPTTQQASTPAAQTQPQTQTPIQPQVTQTNPPTNQSAQVPSGGININNYGNINIYQNPTIQAQGLTTAAATNSQTTSAPTSPTQISAPLAPTYTRTNAAAEFFTKQAIAIPSGGTKAERTVALTNMVNSSSSSLEVQAKMRSYISQYVAPGDPYNDRIRADAGLTS